MTQRDDDFELPLPHNLEAEQATVGACLIDQVALDTVQGMLQPGQIHDSRLRTIYKAILAVKKTEEPVDLITVTARLQDEGNLEKAGGMEYLASLAGSVPTSANVDHYATIVIEKHALRKLIQLATEEAAAARSGEEPAAVIERHVKNLLDLQVGAQKKPFTASRDITLRVLDQIEARFANLKQHGSYRPVTGVPSGYPDIDKFTSGFQKSDLIIVAARPAVGKTAFALNVAQNIAIRAKETVAIFSLEMSAEQLVQRMLAAEGNVDAGRLRSGDLTEDDWPKLTMAAGAIADAPLFIDDTPGIKVGEIRAKCRRLQQEQGLGLVLIDYLQLISGNGGNNRTQEVSEITRALKLMARELNVPVIALSQLSRSVEQRSDKRPMMSDLRESGSIEQDADVVSFLYRDDYYNPESERKNIVEIIIAKQRSGPTGTVELVFLKNFNKFVSLERAPGA